MEILLQINTKSICMNPFKTFLFAGNGNFIDVNIIVTANAEGRDIKASIRPTTLTSGQLGVTGWDVEYSNAFAEREYFGIAGYAIEAAQLASSCVQGNKTGWVENQPGVFTYHRK